MGGKLKLAISGGAALDPEVQSYFLSIGILLLEGYGLTETSPVIGIERPAFTVRERGVGLYPLSNLEIMTRSTSGKELAIGEEGELCVSGPSIMHGYHNLPEETEKALFAYKGKKWFATGDLARILDTGAFSITGRVKDLYKLENGKYVVPGPIEETLKKSRFIHQVFIYGDSKAYNVAIIVPEFTAIKHWLTESKIAFVDDNAKVILMEELQSLFASEIKKKNMW